MSYTILHTSDWHLGKKTYKKSRLQEQTLFLSWLENQISQHEVDALFISGDIFDTAYPPTEALTQYYRFLHNVTYKGSLKIFIISGNHDSGNYLMAPNDFLGPQNIHVVGNILPGNNFFFEVKDRQGKIIGITLLPYLRGDQLAQLMIQLGLTPEELIDTELMTQRLASYLYQQKKSSKAYQHFLLGHHIYCSNPSFDGTEASLALSGLTSLDMNIFKNEYDYLALGHLHKRQVIHRSSPLAVYCGAPIPLQLSEGNSKGVELIKVQESSPLKTTTLKIPLFRATKSFKIKSNNPIEEFKIQLESFNTRGADSLSPWIEVDLTLTRPYSGLMDEIRKIFSHKFPDGIIVRITTNFISSISEMTKTQQKVPEPRHLFDSFFKQKFSTKEMPLQEDREQFEKLWSMAEELSLSRKRAP